MSLHKLPYGRGSRSFLLPDHAEVTVLQPHDRPGLSDPGRTASEELAGHQPLLSRLAGPARRAAIAVNDKTRPVPHDILIPPLLDALESGGWSRREITFIIAVGAHAPMTQDEFPQVLPPDTADGCRIVSHDADDISGLTDLGTTSRGTPCRMNRDFVEADLRLVVGIIDPHQFVGWSGGVKSASIGLGARETIAANHSLLSSDGSGPCLFEGNPVRQDIEEMGRMAGVHLALNVVMNGRKEIVSVLAGPPEEVMLRGISGGGDTFTASFDSPADLVITSPGGFPKDLNLYQAQKSLRHGARAAAPDAPVIIMAACTEGVGSRRYENWMTDKASHRQVKEAFESEEFLLGHHKGMLFADDAIGRSVYLVSELPDETVRNLLLEPVSDLNVLIESLLADRPQPRVAVLPNGNSTVPVHRRR